MKEQMERYYWELVSETGRLLTNQMIWFCGLGGWKNDS